MKLVIVESPTKANTISKFLGKGYKVESSYGHVRDLPKSRFAIDLENNFQPEYIIPIKARKRVTELRKVAEKAKEIILASDEDREGEAIAWHLDKVLRGVGSKTKKGSVSVIEGKPVKRIVFHEITQSAIEEALSNPRELNKSMVEAQQARRILDRVVGYKLSPFLWKKIAKGLSAGRVQSVALRLIVDRENEIKAFKAKEYWSIQANLSNKDQKTLQTKLVKIDSKTLTKFGIENSDQADEIAKDLEKSSYSVTEVKKSEAQKNPSPPFITSTLQQAASRRLNFSAKRTMILAQKLYESGLITYMRTDSTNLSGQSTAAAKAWLTKELGERYALASPRFFKKKTKGAQEAHEAIRPTNTTKPEDVDVKDNATRKLYHLIWSRFLASQMPPAVFNTLKVTINAKGEKEYTLRANGNQLKFDGFLKIYSQQFEEKELPELKENESLTLREILKNQHFTEPPPRFSEARLIKTLEEFGIGRPSTYVPIISVIQSRNYVRKEAGRFYPTEIGELVNKMLTKHFSNIVDVNFTASMEESLDFIAEGKAPWQNLLSEFYGPFNSNLEKKYEEVEKEFTDEETDKLCEKCGKNMMIKFGRFGKFMACSGFPDCKNAQPLEENKPKSIGLKCEKCSEGDIVEKFTRKGRKRKFWGCSRYPDCDFANWKNPLEEEKPKE